MEIARSIAGRGLQYRFGTASMGCIERVYGSARTLDLREDLVIQFGEEGLMQALDDFGDFVFFDDEGEIDL